MLPFRIKKQNNVCFNACFWMCCLKNVLFFFADTILLFDCPTIRKCVETFGLNELVHGHRNVLKLPLKDAFLDDGTGWAQLITSCSIWRWWRLCLVFNFSPCITLLPVFTSTVPLLYFCLLIRLACCKPCDQDAVHFISKFIPAVCV